MQCPYCRTPDGDAYKTKVLETRHWWEPTRGYYYVERRRECTQCKTRFSTKERSPTTRKPEI